MAQKEDFWEVTLMGKGNVIYYLWSLLSEIGRAEKKELNSLSGLGYLICAKIAYENKAFFFLLFISVS